MSHLEIPSAPVEPHGSLDPGVVVPADGEARALCHATQCAMERLRCSGPRAKRGDRSAVVVDCVAESNEDLDLRLAVYERHEVVGGRIDQHVPIITDLRTAVTTATRTTMMMTMTTTVVKSLSPANPRVGRLAVLVLVSVARLAVLVLVVCVTIVIPMVLE